MNASPAAAAVPVSTMGGRLQNRGVVEKSADVHAQGDERDHRRPCAATAAMSERAVIVSVMPICSGMLPCLRAALSHGSITRAAQRLGNATSQPVVEFEKSPMLFTIVGSHMPRP